jgi:hypothetical protein
MAFVRQRIARVFVPVGDGTKEKADYPDRKEATLCEPHSWSPKQQSGRKVAAAPNRPAASSRTVTVLGRALLRRTIEIAG